MANEKRLIDANALLERLANSSESWAKNIKAIHNWWPHAVGIKDNIVSLIKDAPTVDAVSKSVHEQVRWERDVALEQLKMYGIGFGEKADVAKVVRCKDCKYWKHYDHVGCSNYAKVCTLANYMIGHNGYCLYGERKDNER